MIMKPYVSRAEPLDDGQARHLPGVLLFHHLGLDRDMREQFRGHPDFEYTAQFCHLYDQNSFDLELRVDAAGGLRVPCCAALAAPKRDRSTELRINGRIGAVKS